MSQPQLLWTVGFQEELDSPDDRLKCYGIGLSRKPGIWVFTIAGGGHIWKCSIDQEEIQEVGDELLAALEDDDEVTLFISDSFLFDSF